MDKIRVIIKNDQKTVKIPTGMRMIVRRSCNAVLRLENFQGSAEVNVTFVNNEQMRELNKKHRQKDEPTDVLSFPMGKKDEFDVNPETGAKIIGDVVISIERAVEQAKKYGHTLQREVAFLTTHSVLHLLGYDHEAGGMEKVHMREKEEKIMALLGLPSTSTYVLDEEI